MNSRVLKLLTSMVVAVSLVTAPVFGLPDDVDEIDNTDQEGSVELYESIPEATVQDVEESADSWRYSEGELLDDDDSLEATQEELADETVFQSAGYGDKADKSWNVGGKIFSGGYLKGIDISVWQGRSSGLRSKIDWAKVNTDINSKHVYDFVIIRCGYGRNTTDRDDSEFLYNVRECEKYNIPYGVYLYSYAENNSQASSEAAHALRLLKGHYPELPVYYDLEDSSILKATGSSKTKITEFAKIFCSRLDNNGYRAGIYANQNWFSNYIDKSRLKKYSMWVAQWPGRTQRYNCGSSYSMWQCSSGGSVSGIYGRVDINLMVKPYSDMKNFMTYNTLPDTLKVQTTDKTEYTNTDSAVIREGPGRGYHVREFTFGKRTKVKVSGVANGYSEVTDTDGNTGWIAGKFLVSPNTAWGFVKITEGEGEEAVTKSVLKSYADSILKNKTPKFKGYIYGSDSKGEKIVNRTLWIGNKRYSFDKKGHAYIKRVRTITSTKVYEKAGSVRKGTLAKGRAVNVLKISGSWIQMENELWIRASDTKTIAVYPTIRPSITTDYSARTVSKARCFSGPSTSYVQKGTLNKGVKVRVVGTYGSWAKLKTGIWVLKSKLK